MTTDHVPVPIKVCPCPDTPHPDGDIVYLGGELSMRGGMSARSAVLSGITDEITAQMQFARIWLGEIRAWTFTDEDGPVPVSLEAAERLLPWAKGGRLVADAADELYAADALAPFNEAIAQLKRSQRGSTPKTANSQNGQTSPRPTSTTKRRSRSST